MELKKMNVTRIKDIFLNSNTCRPSKVYFLQTTYKLFKMDKAPFRLKVSILPLFHLYTKK